MNNKEYQAYLNCYALFRSCAAKVANVFEASEHPLKVYTTVTKGYVKTRTVKGISIAMYTISMCAESRKHIPSLTVSAESLGLTSSVDFNKEDVQGSWVVLSDTVAILVNWVVSVVLTSFSRREMIIALFSSMRFRSMPREGRIFGHQERVRERLTARKRASNGFIFCSRTCIPYGGV
jgi:hypothetical protein